MSVRLNLFVFGSFLTTPLSAPALTLALALALALAPPPGISVMGFVVS